MATEKKESNTLADAEWNEGREVLTLKFFDGITEKFDTRLTSTGVHMDAKVYGFQVKINRLGAISATDFPTRKERAEEYRRRLRAFRDHCYTGANSWDAPRKAAPAYVVTAADVDEVLTELFGAEKAAVLRPLNAKTFKTPEGAFDPAAAMAHWASSKDGARVWAGIQASRRRSETAASPDAMLAAMLAAAGIEQPTDETDDESDEAPV